MQGSIFSSLSRRVGVGAVWLAFICSAMRATGLAQGGFPVKFSYRPIRAASCISYSPDGTKVAIAGSSIQVFNAKTGSLEWSIPTAIATVTTAAFSPGGESIAIGGSSYDPNTPSPAIIETWSIPSHKLVHSLECAAYYVNSLAFSSDGDLLVSGGDDSGTVPYLSAQIWNVPTGKEVGSLGTKIEYVNSVAFAHNSKTVALGGYNLQGGAVEIWDSSSQKLMSSLPTQAVGTNAVAFSQDDNILASAGTIYNIGTSPVVELWSVLTGKLSKTLRPPSTVVSCLQFSPDGKTLALGANASDLNSGEVELWMVTTGIKEGSFSKSMDSGVKSLCYSQNGKFVATCGNGDQSFAGQFTGVARNWNVASRSIETSFNCNPFDTAAAAVLTPDGKTMIGGCQYNSRTDGSSHCSLIYWNVESGSVFQSDQVPSIIGRLEVSPDGKTLADVTVQNNDISETVFELRSAATGRLLKTLSTETRTYGQIAFSPDGLAVMAAGSFPGADGFVETWNVATGIHEKSLLAPNNTYDILTACYSPDGKSIAFGGTAENQFGISVGIVQVWDVNGGVMLQTLYTLEYITKSSFFSPDGTLLALGGYQYLPTTERFQGDLEVWSTKSWERVASLPVQNLLNMPDILKFSPDSKALFASDMPYVEAFDLDSGALSATAYGEEVLSLSTSKNGQLLAFTDIQGTLVILESPIQGFALSSSTVTGGRSITGTITLATAAPAGGQTITLASTSGDIAFPVTMTIPAGSSTAKFTVSTAKVDKQEAATVTVHARGFSASATLTLKPPTK